MTKQQIIDVIKQEIGWCKKYVEPDTDKLIAEKKGFIKGLKQAIFLIKHIKI